MRKYIYLGISLCMLLTAVFAVGFVYDVLKAAWCAYKGKEYKWKAFEMFTANDDWKTILIWGAVMCIGVYGFFQANADMIRAEYESNMIQCEYCSEEIPGRYIVDDFAYEEICPSCINHEIWEIRNQEAGVCYLCYELYIPNSYTGAGLCESCYEDNYRSCEFCGRDAPIKLRINDVYYCPECLHELLTDENVLNAIQNYYE